MRQFLVLMASTAVFLSVAGMASAADYDPPIFIEQAPEYVPVEVGSGWYLRGDVTYVVDKPLYDFEEFGLSTRNRRFGGSAGVGYNFTDLLRGDVNVGYVAGDELTFPAAIGGGDFDYKAWYGMANGYLDLGTVAGFTPYVGAGIGVLHSRYSFENAGVALSENSYDLAYALNAGLAYQVSDNLQLDVGYQYLMSPKAEYLNTDTLLIDDGVKYHQVKVGLRYDLW